MGGADTARQQIQALFPSVSACHKHCTLPCLDGVLRSTSFHWMHACKSEFQRNKCQSFKANCEAVGHLCAIARQCGGPHPSPPSARNSSLVVEHFHVCIFVLTSIFLNNLKCTYMLFLVPLSFKKSRQCLQHRAFTTFGCRCEDFMFSEATHFSDEAVCDPQRRIDPNLA